MHEVQFMRRKAQIIGAAQPPREGIIWQNAQT